MTYTLTSEETVWNAIITKFNAAISSGSLTYVKKIYEGAREASTTYELPCLIFEPDVDSEGWAEFPRRIGQKINIKITGVLDIRTRLDKQIVGDATQVGILHFKNDIKKAFEGDGTDLKLNNETYGYVFTTLSTKNKDNAIREVNLNLELSLKFFTAGSRI